MSYTFRVVFDGVLAYVPDKPFFPTKQEREKCEKFKVPCDPRSVAVLLPDLRLPGTPSVPEGNQLRLPTFRAPHFPLLSFRLGDLREGTTRRVDLVCRDISQRDEQGILFLRREQIRFGMQAENVAKFDFAGWKPKRGCEMQYGPFPDRPEEVESLWWTPELRRIIEDPRYESATYVRRDFLPSYRGPFPEGLIARIECAGGRLRTFDYNREVDGRPAVWRFAPPAEPGNSGTWNRVLSNSLALEFFDVHGDVRIELRRLANEVIIEELVLAPAPGASRDVVEISISNREPELLFQAEGFARTSLPDMDFQPFYEKLSQADDRWWEHLPVPFPHPLSFFGIREKPCSGTVMLGG